MDDKKRTRLTPADFTPEELVAIRRAPRPKVKALEIAAAKALREKYRQAFTGPREKPLA